MTTTYTIADTPEVVARIESDLAIAQSVVRNGDPHLRALVLTGGFARGEGGMRDGRPQNDYDFVAVRSVGRPRVPYATMTAELERRLGLHIDLAPVPAWRLPYVARSIFWYETARRGRVLWGEPLLGRIRVQTAESIDRREGLRLLVNRAAGLLLVTPSTDAHAHRIQAAKGLLAAFDAHLLARGLFAPSQVERWAFAASVLRHVPLRRQAAWFRWGFHFKVDPANGEACDPRQAWLAARQAILAAVPVALQHAGFQDLAQYERSDGLADHLVFAARARQVPARPRLNPTGKVRVATLRLLEAAADGNIPLQAAQALRPWDARGADPLRLLDRLRHATLQ